MKKYTFIRRILCVGVLIGLFFMSKSTIVRFFNTFNQEPYLYQTINMQHMTSMLAPHHIPLEVF